MTAALSTTKPSTVCALDVGTSKVCAVVAQLTPLEQAASGQVANRTHSIQVKGFGHVRSHGIKSGVVVDMDAADRSIRQALDLAERSAGVTIDSVVVATGAGRLGSDTFSSSISLDGSEVARGDVRAVLNAGRQHAAAMEREVLHALAVGYRIDAEHGIEDPIGMAGDELGVDMHVVSGDAGPLRNLETCINRSHVAVETLVASPFAAGLAVTVADEARLGCAVIDFGAGTTNVAVFLGGHLVFTDAIAVGGNHVTMDLARVLSIRVDDAERLKVLHANANAGQASDSDTVPISTIAANGQDDPAQHSNVSLAQLSRIVAPRIEETMELIRDRLGRSGFAGAVGGRIILTGGASQLSGLPTVAGQVLGGNARIGRPLGMAGLPHTAKGGAFSAVCGLLVHRQQAHLETSAATSGFASLAANPFTALGRTRVGAWLRASL